MKNSRIDYYQRWLGRLVLTAIALHITMALAVLVLPERWSRKIPGHSLYRSLVLVGPFFQASRIKTSPHLFVSTMSQGKWSAPQDYARASFSRYLEAPWRHTELLYGNYERYLTRQISLSLNESNDDGGLHSRRAFRELNQMLMREWINRPVDSIKLVYGLRIYSPATKTSQFDTLLTETYNPADIAPSK